MTSGVPWKVYLIIYVGIHYINFFRSMWVCEVVKTEKKTLFNSKQAG